MHFTQKQCFRITGGHVTCTLHDNKDQEIVWFADSEGFVSCYSVVPFQLIQKVRIFSHFCASLCWIADDLLAGSSMGELVQFTKNGKVIQRVQLSQDCISSIVICDSHVVTTSYDGKVRFVDKINFKTEKEIDLEVPLWNAFPYGDKIYIAGIPSFQLTYPTYQIKTLKRFSTFTAFKDKVYASSDERGLTCLKNNSNSYIACTFMLPLSPETNRMVIFSQECATQITHDLQMSWRCFRMKQITGGATIENGCNIKTRSNLNIMVLADNMGFVYCVQYEIIDMIENRRGIKERNTINRCITLNQASEGVQDNNQDKKTLLEARIDLVHE